MISSPFFTPSPSESLLAIFADIRGVIFLVFRGVHLFFRSRAVGIEFLDLHAVVADAAGLLCEGGAAWGCKLLEIGEEVGRRAPAVAAVGALTVAPSLFSFIIPSCAAGSGLVPVAGCVFFFSDGARSGEKVGSDVRIVALQPQYRLTGCFDDPPIGRLWMSGPGPSGNGSGGRPRICRWRELVKGLSSMPETRDSLAFSTRRPASRTGSLSARPA